LTSGRGDIVKANKLEIGSNVFIDVHAASYADLDVDGVIGFNLLKNGNFLLDYVDMKFAFIDAPNLPLDENYISYETLGRMPYLKSKIGKKDAYINFDTGASQWLYFPLTWKDSISFKAPLKDHKVLTNNQTGKTLTYIGQIKEDVSIGNYTLKTPYVIFDPEIEDLFIGSSLLHDFKLFFYPALG